ncbi:MAG: elongator complex protein 3 [Anaerovoracaceae bacterium]
MKKHAIIPIFIPHCGCPNDCVFCNQRKITAHQTPVLPEDVHGTVETWLSTLEPRHMETIELAFFGGSFTGIPMEEQTAFLQVAKSYKDAGRIHRIHLSTRPDYISREILDNLKRWGVDVIELGVQSFDEDVLKASGRGHDAACVYESSRLIQEYGFTLGIQLMIGLPGDTMEKDIYSARETVKIGPSIARLYPTVVIRDTALYDMYLSGDYMPMAEDDAVERTKAMYQILDAAGINIIRVGLKSSDIITDTGRQGSTNFDTRPDFDGSSCTVAAPSSIAPGTFHPAFRQLVEGAIARESLEAQVLALYPKMHSKPKADSALQSHQSDTVPDPAVCPTAYFVSNAKSRNNLFGHKSANRVYFAKKYPGLNIKYVTDTQLGLQLPDNRYLVVDAGLAGGIESVK